MIERRQCEREIERERKRRYGEWNRVVKIQSGAPLYPRVEAFVGGLAAQGYRVNDLNRQAERSLLEVFPAEALGALGALGAHRGSPLEVCAYKPRCGGLGRPLSLRDIDDLVRAALSGFSAILPDVGGSDAFITEVVYRVSKACAGADGASHLHRKALDDLVDSAIACLTGVTLALDRHHHWGDGTDGVIVGPGKWSQC